MPSILSRFKRSPSNASSLEGDHRHRRSSTVSSSHSNTALISSEDETILSPATSSQSPTGGSRFIENLGANSGSPTKQPKNKPAPLAIPPAANQQVLGTPKLVLTTEGSNSPKSFDSSLVSVQHLEKPRVEGVGLGIATTAGEPLQRAVSLTYLHCPN